ncbi:ELM2 and SANT domain-containing protein 1 isoform X2 [Denticeps clupeoides]|uniref:ELM2 and SANT domain-containing protein 1 isoform X2 n=1 Tax=Denticeps clupeoides TaxID=299321 RepID=UPI0010A2EFB5|nr:ELM2 and SANT domain-containing protein 1 isoform X2 [Denticeps clupeoides]
MSLHPQQKPSSKRTGKRISFFNEQGVAMKQAPQPGPEGSYYGPGPPLSEQGPAPEGPHVYPNSVIFSTDKGEHYQQSAAVKWPQQNPSQQPQQRPGAGWPHGTAMATTWAQNFAPYLGGQGTFAKPASQDGVSVQQQHQQQHQDHLPDKQQQQQLQHQPAALGAPQHPAGSSVLQSFQVAFGQPRQHLPREFYQMFPQQAARTLPNVNYGAQANSQLQQQQEQLHAQRQQQQQQQQILLQQQQQMQQQILQQQHKVLQQQQQAQLVQQQQHTEQLHLQQMQQIRMQAAQRAPHNQQRLLDFYPGGGEAAAPEPPRSPPRLQPADDAHPSQHSLRRSRRLSREGAVPSPEDPVPPAADQLTQRNGNPEGAPRPSVVEEVKAAPTGVIQSTRRKRRVSQEVNLETLAQKASEMESLPSQVAKEPHRPWSPVDQEAEGLSAKRHRDDALVPLVIPVSVPVRPADPQSSPESDGTPPSQSWHRPPTHQDHKPSVIVTRRRSLRNSLSESSGQNGGADGPKDADGKPSKAKRRPRPEPLFIPPPKLGTFIAPPVYSTVTPYQSHLRSPVRLTDNPLALPPYTPPPILSPVREGSGLYFSTFLSAAAANAAGQGLAPPATPKSATRSLLRSNSCDITPPVLSAMGEATPVSIEPRINIGQRYQADIPELRERSGSQYDQHKAELVWAPLPEQREERVDDLTQLACSSVLCGGGTNQELAMHCLHECGGNIMEALALLLLKTPIFPKTHPLGDYHYSGSDSWTASEKRCFNKGIAAYKKDFFMVQKMVSSKSVAQCVEFYYTYKKQVKIARNGTLIYGDTEAAESKTSEEELDVKQSSQRFEQHKEEDDSRKWEGSCDRKSDSSPGRAAQSQPAAENLGTVVILQNQEVQRNPLLTSYAPPPPPKPRPDASGGRKSGVTTATGKGLAGQEGEFPCKKCGRIFYKVKSRSAHMKSHAEQEKKEAALRQKEAEQRRAAAVAAMMAARQNGAREGAERTSSGDSSSEEDADDEDWH